MNCTSERSIWVNQHQMAAIARKAGSGVSDDSRLLGQIVETWNATAAASTKHCPIHGPWGFIAGPRQAGCTCARHPFSEECKGNRWAAFTDDELTELDLVLSRTTAKVTVLREIQAELERRKT